MTKKVRGIVFNYRGGLKTQKPKEYILQFDSILSISDASRLIGRKVAWKRGGNKIVGKIVALHGKKGLVRARFRRGLPGNTLGTSVHLIG